MNGVPAFIYSIAQGQYVFCTGCISRTIFLTSTTREEILFPPREEIPFPFFCAVHRNTLFGGAFSISKVDYEMATRQFITSAFFIRHCVDFLVVDRQSFLGIYKGKLNIRPDEILRNNEISWKDGSCLGELSLSPTENGRNMTQVTVSSRPTTTLEFSMVCTLHSSSIIV